MLAIWTTAVHDTPAILHVCMDVNAENNKKWETQQTPQKTRNTRFRKTRTKMFTCTSYEHSYNKKEAGNVPFIAPHLLHSLDDKLKGLQTDMKLHRRAMTPRNLLPGELFNEQCAGRQTCPKLRSTHPSRDSAGAKGHICRRKPPGTIEKTLAAAEGVAAR